METPHRPIIVKGMDKLLSLVERKQIIFIVSKLLELDRQQDVLVKEYRKLVGFQETDIGFSDQIDEISEWGVIESWVKFAEEARRRWFIEDLQLPKQ